MSLGGTLLPHGEKWAATVEDRRTVRIILEGLTKALEEHWRIVETIPDPEAKADFIATFQNDVDRCEAVIAICEKRIEEWSNHP